MIESYKLSSEFIAFVPQHCLYIFLFFIRFPRTADSEVFSAIIYVIKCYLQYVVRVYVCVCIVCFILSR